MEVIGVAAGVLSACVAFVGLFWTIVFGQQRNLVDLMTTRRSKPTTATTSTPATGTARRAPRQKPQLPTPPTERRLYDRWVAITGRLVLDSWAATGDLDFDPYTWDVTLPGLSGCALHLFLIAAPVLLVAGLFITGVGLVVENGGGAIQFGLSMLVGFLTAFIAEFFILGTIALIGAFHAILPRDISRVDE